MTIAESLVKKALELPADKQLMLLNYALQLAGKSAQPRGDPEGILADKPTGLSFEDFQQCRKEMWGKSADRELDKE